MTIREFFSAAFWQFELLGNSLIKYAIALIIFLGGLILLKFFQEVIVFQLKKITKKTKTDVDDAIVRIVHSVRPSFYPYLALYFAFKLLSVHSMINRGLDIILIIFLVYQVVAAAQVLIDYLVEKKFGEERGREAQSAVSIIKLFSKLTLWFIALLLVLSNLGVDITSLIAGLGIGGIAIALAAQNILGDLFSSFAIYFDKPFVVGDFIVVGDSMGVVEKIGIKTTRLKALQGEEVVLSNKELTAAKIQNFKKMQERRIVIKLGVVYQTSGEKIKKILGIVKEIIDGIGGIRFDRAHFKAFDDSALIFEIVYYVETGDYNKYMDQNQEINLKLKEAFEKENIEMAYPTQTVYLEK